MGHVRENLNPLAADDHMKEVIQQLQLMGEVSHFPTDRYYPYYFQSLNFPPKTHQSNLSCFDRLCT